MIRKEVIKTVITPYLKSKSFLKKGVLYTKDIGLFQMEVQIQSQRYYVDKDEENFRINYYLFCDEFTKRFGQKAAFAYGYIVQAGSWIDINPSTDGELLKKWLLGKLDSMMVTLEQYSNPSFLLSHWKSYSTDLQYPFLLEKFKPKALDNWTTDILSEISQLDAKLLELTVEKSEQEKREDGLDKKTGLDGLSMRINDTVSKKNSILKTIDYFK